MRTGRVLTAVIVSAIALTTIGVAAPVGAQSSKVPGVTAKEILVGGVAAITNPTGAPYDASFDGAKAYFDMVNKKGGVFGKKFKVVGNLDDQTRASKNLLVTRSLVEERNVFAVVPMATQAFASAQYLADKGVPTFGWNIQSDWAKGPNLFGEKGSWLCFGAQCTSIAPNYVAKKEGAKAAGVLAYGSSPQSADCAKAIESTFNKYGPRVGFADRSLTFGFSANDISAGVQAVKDNGVDFIAPCIDANGAINFRKALNQAGVSNVKWYAPEGYGNEELIERVAADLDGFTFVVSFTPFEAADISPGTAQFLKELKKTGTSPSEHALAGWQSAMLLHEGIKRAGKKFTRESVVSEINQISDWSANGTRAIVDWTTAHGPTPPNSQDCSVYLQLKNGKFEIVYGQPGKPYVCFPENPYPATLDNPTYARPGEG